MRESYRWRGWAVAAALVATACWPVAGKAADEAAAMCQCVCPTAVEESSETTIENEATVDTTTGETPAETTATAPISYSLELSELLPDPDGDDAAGEFIELHNPNAFDASLEGWFLNISDKNYALPAVTVAAGGYRYLLRVETKATLTNAGATVRLLRGTNLIHETTYAGPAKTGKSWARNPSGLWSWTLPTPGATNIFEVVAPIVPIIEESVATAIVDVTPTPSVVASVQPTVTEVSLVDVAAPFSSANVRISELLPNPVGSDDMEWIEVMNDGDVATSLAGWSVDDDPNGSQPFFCGPEIVVPAHGFLLLPKALTKIGLNNDGDSVRLFDVGGTLIDFAEYRVQAREGESWSRGAAGWGWTTPTPEEANGDIPESESKDANGAVVAATTEVGGGNVAEPLAYADWGDLAFADDGDDIALRGVVSLPPGVIGKTLFAVQDEKGTAGVIVRAYGKNWPSITAGSIIGLRGRLTRSGEDLRLGVSVANVALETGTRNIAPASNDLVSLSSDLIGVTIAVSGEVSAFGKKWLKLMAPDGGTTMRVALPEMFSEAVAVGSVVQLQGVLRWISGQPEIVVVRSSDLLITPPAPKPAVEEAPAVWTPTISASAPTASRRWLSLLLLVPVAAVLGAHWYRKRREAEAVGMGN